MALETLPEMFWQFKVNYNIKKINTSRVDIETLLKTKILCCFLCYGPFFYKLKGQERKQVEEVQQGGPRRLTKKADGRKVQGEILSLWTKRLLEKELLEIPSFQKAK